MVYTFMTTFDKFMTAFDKFMTEFAPKEVKNL